MNTLSWLIYAAGISGNLAGYAMFGVIACVIWFVGLQMAAQHAADFHKDADATLRRRLSMKSFPFAVAFAIISSVIPSKETVYAIAASEMGERAIATPTGGKAVKALNAWLDKQIEDEPEPKPDKD